MLNHEIDKILVQQNRNTWKRKHGKGAQVSNVAASQMRKSTRACFAVSIQAVMKPNMLFLQKT